MTRWLARCGFFLSGVAGLTFELVWTRHLGLAMGATTLAVATTTAAYMGGLALGSHLGGKIADRRRRPLAVYGALEIGIGLLGWGIPAVCRAIPAVDAFVLDDLTGSYGRAMLRFFVAAAVLVLPTTAMGMTLPLLARAVTDRVGRVGREVGSLYAINICGAMIGAAASGFWWIPRLGLESTNLVAVGTDLALGAAAVVGGFLVPALAPAGPDARRQAHVLRPGAVVLIAVLAVTGATAMALQVLWTRALGTALGPSTYAFSAIVCTYLAGLALGSSVAAAVADRVRSVHVALAAVLLATGSAALVGITWVDDLPLLLHGVVLDPELTIGGLVRTEFLLAALSVLPATVGMGAIFPLTVSAVVGSRENLGAGVGRAYAVNTVGAIVGSFAGVFLLLPAFGVEWGMRVAALTYFVVAGALLLRAHADAMVQPRRALLGVTAVVFVAGLLWPSWDVGQWTLGLFRLSMTRAYFATGDPVPAEIIFHADGLASTVTVEQEGSTRWIKVNGKIDGSDKGDMPTQLLSGLLPMLLHPDPKNVAVIGCGSCVTVGATLQAGARRVTLVELESSVVKAAELFEHVNFAPWKDPRLTIVEDDGRNFMQRSRESFDVIVSEPSNPWMTGAASLFTQEFFRIAAQRLESDGIFVQWLQIYELAPERITSMLKTFGSVFPSVMVFSAHVNSNDLLLVGSAKPVSWNWQRLEDRFNLWRDVLLTADLERVGELVALLLFTDEHIRTLPEDVPLNTDDNAFIEFGAPLDLIAFAQVDPDLEFIEALRGTRLRILEPLIKTDPQAWPNQLVEIAEGYARQGMLADAAACAQAAGALLTAEPSPVAERARTVEQVARLLNEEDGELVMDEPTARADPDYAELVRLVLNGEDEEALLRLRANASLRRRGGAHALLHGYLLYRRGDDAHDALLAAARDDHMTAFQPAIAYYLAKDAYEQGEFVRAVAEMSRYHQMRSNAPLGGNGDLPLAEVP